MVRAVVVNHNSGPLVARAVRSLLALDWPADRLDVVVIDNASTDDGLDELPEDSRLTLVRNDHNLGFGAAVNQGRTHAGRRPDAVLLLNPDAWIEPDALDRLTSWLAAEARVGAVAPRIVFDRPMAEVVVTTDRQVQARLIDARVDGEPVFDSVHALAGADRRPRRDGTSPWLLDHEATFHLPHGRTATFTMTARRAGEISLRSGDAEVEVTVAAEPTTVTLDLAEPPLTVIQNDGSWVARDGTGHNRHFHARTDAVGDDSCDVFAWCGAAVVLRTDMLDQLGGFADDFFLYYEDTDLSWRGRAGGWRHVVEPAAVVHHRHSASTGQGQAVTEINQHRNRVLMVMRNGTLIDAVAAVVGLAGTAVSAVARAVGDRLSGGPGDLTRARWRWRSLAGVLAALPRTLGQRRALARTAHRARRDVAAELGG